MNLDAEIKTFVTDPLLKEIHDAEAKAYKQAELIAILERGGQGSARETADMYNHISNMISLTWKLINQKK